MNTNHLAQLYHTLTPCERLPLIIAAAVRGDTTEQKRLSGSAPKWKFEVPDYFPLGKALAQVVDYHVLTLLDLAADLWQWWGVWMSYPLRHAAEPAPKKGRRRRADADRVQAWRAGSIARYYASRFVAHIEGWKQFCADLQIDPKVQVQFMIGWDNIQRTEASARELVFDAEEAARFVRLETAPVEGDDTLERGPQPVETAAEVARGWHAMLDKMLRHEGGA